MRYLLLLVLSSWAIAQTPTTVLNPQYSLANPIVTDPASPTWSAFKFSADFVPPFDYEFVSLVIGNHSFHQNSYTPRGSIVSSSSVLLIGWDTPTDADCLIWGCRVANGQAGITVSMLARNRVSPTVGLMLDVNPGVDLYNGVWGINVNASNHGHTSTGGSGILGAEFNLGEDDAATDIPNPGVRGQVIGVAVTESSMNRTGKRMTAAFAVGVGGTQNPHHGLWAAASPTAQTPMDDIVHVKGPVTTAIDLRDVKSGPIAVALPAGAGLALGQIKIGDLPWNMPPGTEFWCTNCAPHTDPCIVGNGGSKAVSTGKYYRCD